MYDNQNSFIKSLYSFLPPELSFLRGGGWVLKCVPPSALDLLQSEHEVDKLTTCPSILSFFFPPDLKNLMSYSRQWDKERGFEFKVYHLWFYSAFKVIWNSKILFLTRHNLWRSSLELTCNSVQSNFSPPLWLVTLHRYCKAEKKCVAWSKTFGNQCLCCASSYMTKSKLESRSYLSSWAE